MRTIRVVVVCCLFALVFLGCAERLSPPEIDLHAAASQVVPVFASNTTAQALGLSPASRAIAEDSPLYHLWCCLQEYDETVDGGQVDGSNIYMFLSDAKKELDAAFGSSDEIPPTEISAPFDFGEAGIYDHAGNREETEGAKITAFGTAYRIDGDVAHFLLTSRWDERETDNGSLTLCQIQGFYDQANGDLDLNMTYLVEYASGERYIVRSEIVGNETEHSFQMRVGVFGQFTDGTVYGTSFVGAGVSRGENNKFVIRLAQSGSSGELEAARYYVFPGDADMEAIETMDPLGYATAADLPDAVSNYATTTDGLQLFTYTDVPHSLDDFNNSSIRLDF
jgi:hypothetical protein